jgi:hypothetical protein
MPNNEQSDDLANYKLAIIQKYGHEALAKSWFKVRSEIKQVTERFPKKGL